MSYLEDMSASEYALIERGISSVSEWASECVAGRISCGNFLVHWPSSRGNSTEVRIFFKEPDT